MTGIDEGSCRIMNDDFTIGAETLQIGEPRPDGLVPVVSITDDNVDIVRLCEVTDQSKVPGITDYNQRI